MGNELFKNAVTISHSIINQVVKKGDVAIAAIKEYLLELPRKMFELNEIGFINKINDPPRIFIVQKNPGGTI